MYTTTHDTLDMIRDYLDGTLTPADAEGWAALQDFARAIRTADPEAANLDAQRAAIRKVIVTTYVAADEADDFCESVNLFWNEHEIGLYRYHATIEEAEDLTDEGVAEAAKVFCLHLAEED